MRFFTRALYAIYKHTPHTVTEKNSKVFDVLRPGDIAIDCGANVGNVTEKMANRGATVYAFEPNPYAYKVLKKRFQNNLNVHCINKAVWDRTDRLKLYLHEHSNTDQVKWSAGSSLSKEKSNVSSSQYVEVDVIDLVQFISELSEPIKLLKIDIEGLECDVLNALIDAGIAKNITSILVETHEMKIPSLIAPMQALKKKIQEQKLTNINLRWI